MTARAKRAAKELKRRGWIIDNNSDKGCSVCNYPMRHDSRFCQNCGARVDPSFEECALADLEAAIAASLKNSFDLVAHLERQRAFSERTFGPGSRTAGVLDHIRKELIEIEAQPDDVSEWVDVILLALDGAWRAGFSPEQIAQAIAAKQERNESRQWPDWRTAKTDKAIEHVRADKLTD